MIGLSGVFKLQVTVSPHTDPPISIYTDPPQYRMLDSVFFSEKIKENGWKDKNNGTDPGVLHKINDSFNAWCLQRGHSIKVGVS